MQKIFIVFLLSFYLPCVAQKLRVAELSVEYQDNPLAIEALSPRLSWKLLSEQRNTVQTSYEIRVSKHQDFSKNNLVWSVLRSDNQSTHIPYMGLPLKSKARYYWQVRVKDNHGNTSAWSPVHFWGMGMAASDWRARWITVPDKDTAATSPLFRKEILLKKNVRSAVAYISAKGLYEAYINGERIGDSYFTPGWTSYNKRLQYQVYDVSGSLNVGANSIGAVLGDGWYKGYTGIDKRNVYGDTRALLFQLEVSYLDGTSEIFQSDESWKTSYGAIRSSDIYNGEVYDARLEKDGWNSIKYADTDWLNVRVLDAGTDILVSSVAPPVRKQESFKPIKIFTTPKGETIADFGQNLVGWVRLKAKGRAGTTITLSHAEVLDRDGNFYIGNLRKAKQQNSYILKDTAEQSFEPHFTFQGFRYVKIEGYAGKVTADDLTAIALYSDMTPTGKFSSSNPLLNQLQHNIQWGQKGNFLDVPTDCPQRDERLGWTGDVQAFYLTAAYNMDVAGFFGKWLKDLKADQLANGNVPYVIPNPLGEGWAGSAGWGDAATIVPWAMYQTYGDKRILEDQYNSMKSWLNYISNNSPDFLWKSGHHFGDWLFYAPGDDVHGRAAVTSKYLIAQIFFAHSTQIMINTAEVLGKQEDVVKFSNLLGKVKEAFVKEYLTANGLLVSDTQTAYTLALQFDMLPEGLRAAAAGRLVANIRNYGNHLTTGFLGTPYLCHVLSRYGHVNVAYDLLLQESYPSWLYPVKMGATTIWERWDGIKPDGSFQNPEMNSFNHYAYGAVGDWMYKNIAGINPDESQPGYQKIQIAPQPAGRLTSARGELITLYGKISSSWRIENGRFLFDVTIPGNTTALVVLPGAADKLITESDEDIKTIKEIALLKTNGSSSELKLGSGTYHFEYAF